MASEKLRKMIKVISSPNYSDEGLPWYHTGISFKRWVWETLLSEGSGGRFPQSIKEAIDIAQNMGYEVVVAKKYIDPKPLKV